MAHAARSTTASIPRPRPVTPDRQALPHPSWRRALGSAPGVDGQRLVSASEFWSRLGI